MLRTTNPKGAKLTEKKVILVMGKRGSGKTYLVNKLVAAERRLIIWDRMSEYKNGVVFTAEHKMDFAEFFCEVYRKNFRLIYRPLHPKEEITWIAELVYALGNVTFVVEEIDSICTAYKLDETFEAIINRGRHKAITLIGVTPAPFGIHRDLTRQAKEVYVFNTNEPRDLQYLRDLLGTQMEQKVMLLQQYEYALWRDGQPDVEVRKG